MVYPTETKSQTQSGGEVGSLPFARFLVQLRQSAVTAVPCTEHSLPVVSQTLKVVRSFLDDLARPSNNDSPFTQTPTVVNAECIRVFDFVVLSVPIHFEPRASSLTWSRFVCTFRPKRAKRDWRR